MWVTADSSTLSIFYFSGDTLSINNIFGNHKFTIKNLNGESKLIGFESNELHVLDTIDFNFKLEDSLLILTDFGGHEFKYSKSKFNNYLDEYAYKNNVSVELPKGSQTNRFLKRSLTMDIFLGTKNDSLQLKINNKAFGYEEIVSEVNAFRNKISEVERSQLQCRLFIDKNLRMEFVEALLYELQVANARRILFIVDTPRNRKLETRDNFEGIRWILTAFDFREEKEKMLEEIE